MVKVLYALATIFYFTILPISSFHITENDILKNLNVEENFLNIGTVTVQIENGRVRGRRARTLFNNRLYYEFRGIPYARPPINELRFKPPQKPANWTGVLNAYNFGNQCVQTPFAGSEDCLFINVYTPNVSPTSKLPVLLAIHGGAYIIGSGDEIGPDFLLNQENIIIVSFNYRLGPFGFLSMGTPEYSGNMGLKDQLLAIKWTNENIHSFGGDKNKITLYGISAGSSSVHAHVLSPASRGLFHRAIMASGVIVNPWAVTFENHLPRLFRFGKIINLIDCESE